jgi:putative general porin
VASFRSDSWALDGTYYVNPIDDGSGPFELASFVNPTTRVSAAASRVGADLNDPAAYTLSGAFVLPGDKWYVGASYSSSTSDDTPYFPDFDGKGYGVSAGRYLGPRTTMELDVLAGRPRVTDRL